MRNDKGQFVKQTQTALVGKKFGQLTVCKDSGLRRSRGVLWTCKCSCGNITNVRGDSLKSGNTTSCGCVGAAYRSTIKKINDSYVDNTEVCVLDPKVSYSHNTSGIRGVSLDRKSQKYRAYIQFQKKMYNLGYFKTLEEASNARKEAEEQLYKPTLKKYSYLLKSDKH